MSPAARPPRATFRGRLAALFCLAATLALGPSQPAAAQNAATLLKQADSAYEAGARDRARTLYLQVLERDPGNSRAVFQVGLFAPKGSAEAIERFRRYTELEPTDPWGFITLGDALARAGDVDAALAEYVRAREIAPQIADVYTGAGRILGEHERTDELIALYELWTLRQPGSATAWFELARVRHRAGRYLEAADAYAESLALKDDARTLQLLADALAWTAPALKPFYGRSTDSDDNEENRWGLRADWQLGKRARWGLHLERADVESPFASATADELALTARWQPRRTIDIDALGGIARLDAGALAADTTEHTLVRLRARWRSPTAGPQAELRVSRYPLAATPGLIAQPVELDEQKLTVEFPLSGPYRLRLHGHRADLESALDVNERSGSQLALVYRWKPAVEFHTTLSQLEYDNPTSAGYFAPRRVEAIEVGTYFEYWDLWPFSIAVDAGAGLQRVGRFGQPLSDESGTFRLWTLLSWALKPGMNLDLEIEHEDSDISATAVSPSSDWRYTSVTLSLRFGIGARPARSYLAERERAAAKP